MQYFGEAIIKTLYYYIALAIVLFGYNLFSSLDQEAEDFLYLSSVVKNATDGKNNQLEQVKALTKWLSTEITKTTELPGWERPDYPDWVDQSSVAAVIKGGVANCGLQASTIITLSRYLGIRGHRRYWIGKQSGSEYQHAFAELVVDGKPAVFDPNALVFQEDEDGHVLSLRELVNDPSLIENDYFKKVATEIRDNPRVLTTTSIPATPEPLGEHSYDIYASFGPVFTEMYIHLKRSPLSILLLSWIVFLGINAIRDIISKRAIERKVKTD